MNCLLCFPQVEVRLRDGRGISIHMFCGSRPGILLSAMRAMDNLGLDIQQAVISCFNGFALDVFRAEVTIFYRYTSKSIETNKLKLQIFEFLVVILFFLIFEFISNAWKGKIFILIRLRRCFWIQPAFTTGWCDIAIQEEL